MMEVRALYGRLSCGWLGGGLCVARRYSGKWAWLAGHGRCTASSWAQRVVRVNWGLSSKFLKPRMKQYTKMLLLHSIKISCRT